MNFRSQWHINYGQNYSGRFTMAVRDMIGVLCDARGDLVIKTMKHFKLPYDVIVGFQPYVSYPNPIRGNMLLNKMNVREKQVLYIGTTKDSEKQARCCQFQFDGGQWGANEVKELKVSMIKSPKDAIGLIKKMTF